jgi:hypothetical protein
LSKFLFIIISYSLPGTQVGVVCFLVMLVMLELPESMFKEKKNQAHIEVKQEQC